MAKIIRWQLGRYLRRHEKTLPKGEGENADCASLRPGYLWRVTKTQCPEKYRVCINGTGGIHLSKMFKLILSKKLIFELIF